MGSAKRIQEIVKQYEGDRTRLLDIVRDVQAGEGYISDEALVEIAKALGIHRVEVEDMVSFYHFLPPFNGQVSDKIASHLLRKPPPQKKKLSLPKLFGNVHSEPGATKRLPLNKPI